MPLIYQITFNGGAQLEAASGLNSTIAPMLAKAVKTVAAETAASWQASVHQAKLWSGERDAYAATITWNSTGDFSAEVTSDYKHAKAIETGRAPRDLKAMLDTSQKVRRTLDGRRFLIIPMRHNTSGNGATAPAMPGMVGKLAKAMAPSKVVGMGQRQSGEVVSLSPNYGMSKGRPNANFLTNTKTGKANMVASRSYAWGDKISAAALREAGASNADVKRYAGMVRMDNSTSKAKSSSYLTFRVMMEGSKGWIIPAQPGLFIARDVAKDMQPKATAEFQAAISKLVSG